MLTSIVQAGIIEEGEIPAKNISRDTKYDYCVHECNSTGITEHTHSQSNLIRPNLLQAAMNEKGISMKYIQ